MSMKKFIVFLLLGLFSFVNISHAGLITYTVLSGDTGLSYNHLNDSFETLFDEINGNLEAVNILADSLTEPTMADNINPRVRDNEQLGSFTFTGMLPATSATLISNISAGTSYVEGYRIVTSATSHTYTASRDTWVYIDINGAFQYSEVAVGATQPTTPSNSLLLAQVTTDGTAITTVTDKRQTTPPSLRIYQDTKIGAVISRDISSAVTIGIGRGTIDFGSGIALRRNIVTSDVVFSSTGRGGLDTGSQAANTYYYIWAVPDSDNSNNYEGVASTSATATALAITGERLIGWCYSSGTSTISPDSVGAYRGLGGDAPNYVKRIARTNVTTTSTSAVIIPETEVKFYSSGRPLVIEFYATMENSGTGGQVISLSADNIGLIGVSTRGDGAADKFITPVKWVGTLDKGTHSINATWETDSGTLSQKGLNFERIITVQEL